MLNRILLVLLFGSYVFSSQKDTKDICICCSSKSVITVLIGKKQESYCINHAPEIEYVRRIGPKDLVRLFEN